MLEKNQLRKKIQQQRKLLSKTEVLENSKKIAETLLNLSVIQNCQSIAIYLANNNEVETIFLIEQLYALGKKCYLPVLDKHQPNHLLFVQYKPGDPLQLNQYKIFEPILSDKKQQIPNQLDVILMPLVAFDKQGNRLGMGGGYYDRTFAFRKNAVKKKPLLIGLAYQFQCISEIFTENWDISMDMVVTEERSYGPF